MCKNFLKIKFASNLGISISKLINNFKDKIHAPEALIILQIKINILTLWEINLKYYVSKNLEIQL